VRGEQKTDWLQMRRVQLHERSGCSPPWEGADCSGRYGDGSAHSAGPLSARARAGRTTLHFQDDSACRCKRSEASKEEAELLVGAWPHGKRESVLRSRV